MKKIIGCLIILFGILHITVNAEPLRENPFQYKELNQKNNDVIMDDMMQPPEPDAVEDPIQNNPPLNRRERINEIKGITKDDYLVGSINNVEIYFNNKENEHKYITITEQMKKSLKELNNE